MKSLLINDDCLVAMDKIEDKSVDLVICDLPYGVTKARHDNKIPLRRYVKEDIRNKETILYEDDYLLLRYKEGVSYDKARKDFSEKSKEGIWEKYERIVKDNGAIILFGQDKFTTEVMLSNIKNHRYNLIWEKLGQPTGFLNANRMPLRSHEDIMVFYKNPPEYFPQKTEGTPNHSVGKPKNSTNNNYGTFYVIDNKDKLANMKHPRSVLKYKKPHPAIFPTQKSVELCEWIVKSYSKEYDLILDNCMGSGTTGIACIKNNRNFIGIEKDKDNFNLAKERIGSVKYDR